MMKIKSGSPEETLRLGKILGKNLKAGDIVCLYGELGAGKTVLTKGIALGLGIAQSLVVSPSFVLIRQYDRGRVPLYHFDLYRLRDHQDILILGYEEYFYDDGVAVIEWPERLGTLFPEKSLRIMINIKGKTQRLFEFKPKGSRYEALAEKINAHLRH